MQPLTAAPPLEPPIPPVTAVATGGPPERPCAVCGVHQPIVGPGSSWPWTNGTRICVPCLRKVDE